MSHRLRRVAVLAAFLSATGTQYLLHAHLDGRHHEVSCTDDLASLQQARHGAGEPRAIRALDEPFAPTHPHQASCPSCSAPAATFRAPTGVLHAAVQVAGRLSLDGGGELRTFAALGYDLRGPPLA